MKVIFKNVMDSLPLKKRWPAKHEIAALFSICVFLFHIWSIPAFLYRVPGMILYLNAWELTRLLAYNQAATLLECILVTAVLVTISFALPSKYFKSQFLFQGTFLVSLTAFWSIFFHQLEPFILKIHPTWFEKVQHLTWASQTVRNWISSDSYLLLVLLTIWMTWYLGLIVLSPKISKQYSNQKGKISSLAERVSVLSAVFILVDLIGLLIVIFSNLI